MRYLIHHFSTDCSLRFVSYFQCYNERNVIIAGCGLIPVISTLRRLGHKDYCEFKATLGYLVSSKPTWAPNKNKQNKIKRRGGGREGRKGGGLEDITFCLLSQDLMYPRLASNLGQSSYLCLPSARIADTCLPCLTGYCIF